MRTVRDVHAARHMPTNYARSIGMSATSALRIYTNIDGNTVRNVTVM
jgi:hypothetical protein